MEHWWDEIRWLRRHALLAPFGVFAATMLLTWEMEQWQWHGRSSWALAMTLVDMGAVLYGMAAVAVERSVKLMFFWAWDEHKKAQAQARKEVTEEVTKAVTEAVTEAVTKSVTEEVRQAVTEEVRRESAAQIRDLETANRDLHARLAELESRRGRPYRRVLRRQRTV